MYSTVNNEKNENKSFNTKFKNYFTTTFNSEVSSLDWNELKSQINTPRRVFEEVQISFERHMDGANKKLAEDKVKHLKKAVLLLSEENKLLKAEVKVYKQQEANQNKINIVLKQFAQPKIITNNVYEQALSLMQKIIKKHSKRVWWRSWLPKSKVDQEKYKMLVDGMKSMVSLKNNDAHQQGVDYQKFIDCLSNFYTDVRIYTGIFPEKKSNTEKDFLSYLTHNKRYEALQTVLCMNA